MKTKEEMLKRGEGNFFHCTDYEDAIEAMEAYANQSKWISVDERLPENLEWVIVYDKIHGIKSAYLSEDFSTQLENVWINSSSKYYDVTHWQPLPEKP